LAVHVVRGRQECSMVVGRRSGGGSLLTGREEAGCRWGAHCCLVGPDGDGRTLAMGWRLVCMT
jgi:hypothetical protein